MRLSVWSNSVGGGDGLVGGGGHVEGDRGGGGGSKRGCKNHPPTFTEAVRLGARNRLANVMTDVPSKSAQVGGAINACSVAITATKRGEPDNSTAVNGVDSLLVADYDPATTTPLKEASSEQRREAAVESKGNGAAEAVAKEGGSAVASPEKRVVGSAVSAEGEAEATARKSRRHILFLSAPYQIRASNTGARSSRMRI